MGSLNSLGGRVLSAPNRIADTDRHRWPLSWLGCSGRHPESLLPGPFARQDSPTLPAREAPAASWQLATGAGHHHRRCRKEVPTA